MVYILFGLNTPACPQTYLPIETYTWQGPMQDFSDGAVKEKSKAFPLRESKLFRSHGCKAALSIFKANESSGLYTLQKC